MGGIQLSVLALREQAVEFRQRRWPENHGSSTDTAWIEKEGPQPEQEPIQG
jgi:hypothetical protein